MPQTKFGTIVPLEDDGRFRFEGLVPGIRYGGDAVEAGRGLGNLFRDVVVKPGEFMDLGDRKIHADRPGAD